MSSDWRWRCAAIIPCLNEARTVGSLVLDVKSSVETVIVVDDGSTDQTAEIAKNSGARVIRHDTTLGKGASLKAGWEAARRQGSGWAFCLDGDGQHDPALMPAFFDRADSIGAALVIGNRMDHAVKMPLVRRVVNRWMSKQLSRKAGVTIPDSQCGYRLMNLTEYAKLKIASSHFEIESEIVLAFAKAGLKIGFVPIPVIYGAEVSKINPVTDTLRWLKWWKSLRS